MATHPGFRSVHVFPLDFAGIARGEIADQTIRNVIRFGLAAELRRLNAGGPAEHLARKMQFVRERRTGPIATHVEAANEQHYDVPAAFFEIVLGPRMKYSATCWPADVDSLEASEEASLALVCERARVEDGQRILDLGCGWGAFSLYVAERYPRCRVLALSNAQSQRAFIEQRARERGLSNVSVCTADIAAWRAPDEFDRIVSIEMFEHMRNYEALLARLAGLLAPGGCLFVHVFSHARHAYAFEKNWTATRFFTGGLMPSDDLFLHFQRDLDVADRWCLDGTHYQRTSEAWLARLDGGRAEALDVLGRGRRDMGAERALGEWRVFFMLCAESFGYAGGREWLVSHYLFTRRAPS